MNQSSATVSWQAIQQEVLRRIHSREWKPGELIPNEAEIAAEFGCARATVNRALRSLAEDGLLERRRKAGTRVALNPVRRAILAIPVIRLEIQGRGMSYEYALLKSDREPPPPSASSQLALDSDAEALHVEAVHLADGHPYVFEDRWVNIASVPGIEDADLSAISANEWLLQNVPFTDGDFAIGAVNATDRAAELLKARKGEALLTVQRTTWDGQRPITTVVLTFAPGHRMQTTL